MKYRKVSGNVYKSIFLSFDSNDVDIDQAIDSAINDRSEMLEMELHSITSSYDPNLELTNYLIVMKYQNAFIDDKNEIFFKKEDEILIED